MVRTAVKVLVNGYGVIGKRVADAVIKQDDLKLVGISDVVADWRVKMAQAKGINVYASLPEKVDEMKKGGVQVHGTLENLLRDGDVDVVVDCTPAKVGAKNKSLYEKYGIKGVFQGGERHEVAGISFVAQRNYEDALGKQFVRVVSCNTTAICRVVGGLHERLGVSKARVVIIRRAVDVWESSRTGIMNTVVPELHIPSHHGPDAQTVIPSLNITTLAAKGSHNLYHLHMAMVELKNQVRVEDVINVLESEPRIVFVSGSDGVEGLNSIFEISRDLGRSRGDLYEVPVWYDSISVSHDGKEVYLIWATPNESNVIPENIDAIRSITELESNRFNSIKKTDTSLNVIKKLY
ncbi:MAG: type II glyceraldehyde-3-phosphate dehydrogenase [Sulfolobales archaeon]|nr:type II glyceraldehyde-3-phosphate dehydrogenase [Sulfolobales archaeon]MCX8185890.1 type II glyceraldehyde-3-phosphate dehydrogenase [Sulfolobales archaeon]MDW7969147.1 type II glyceraldehyde-3-phosphate dehydrogenase [Sulfolobales archaeon]